MKNIKIETEKAILEILDEANLQKGSIFLVGCSTSEVAGGKIGKNSNEEVGKIIFDTIKPILDEREIFLAVQCCEHLNRAIVIEESAISKHDEIVNVVPQLHAGGAFAVEAYTHFEKPVVLEEIKADAGIDIGQTLIGMNLKRVAVPLRIETKKIGEAIVLGARTRPKFIGGYRASYDSRLAKGK